MVLIRYDCTLKIISYMVAKMETYVCECFNSLEVDEKKVDELISAVEVDRKSVSGPKCKAARKELRNIYSNMKAEGAKMKGARGGMYAIRECMDDAFMQHLGPSSKVGALFANQRSFRWTHAMTEYLQDVIEELPKVVATIESADVSPGVEDQEAIASLKWCVAKIKVLGSVSGMSVDGVHMAMVPFMSRSVYTHMANRLEVIGGSLKEVRPSSISGLLYRAFRGGLEMRDRWNMKTCTDDGLYPNSSLAGGNRW